MPLAAVAVRVPLRVLPPGLFNKEILTPPVKLVTTFPSASSVETVKPNPLPAVAVGGAATTNCVAAPGETEMAFVVAAARVPLAMSSM